MYYVYVLRSLKDGKKYIGTTQNPEERLKQHNQGNTQSTKRRRPFKLEFYQAFDNKYEAVSAEKKYKRSHDALLRAMKKNNPV